MKNRISIIILIIILMEIAASSESRNSGHTEAKVPVFELPYNSDNGYSFPGMNQSLFITADISQITHQVILDSFQPDANFLKYIPLFVWDYFFFTLPAGPAWLHEEWHRAVMGQYGINSFNDVYRFNIFADTIAVSHVRDENLAWLKNHHNPDMVRLAEAGNEAEIELVREYRRDSFFNYRPMRYELFQIWLTLINSSAYVILCSSSEADTLTEQMNIEDGSNIKKRDFTGLDFTAWIYDLNRPDESYTARGVHPSGRGIDRYIKYSDLTDSEKKYLNKTGKLTLLNFISPQIFGIERFSIDDNSITGPGGFNFMIVHHLTSFGNDVIFSTLFKNNKINIETSFHCYNNKEHYFPGFGFAVKRYPVTIFNTKFYSDYKLTLYNQPRDQRFHEDDGEAGGFIGTGFYLPLSDERIELFIEGDAKSDGWIEGNVYLGKSIQGRSGFIIHI